MKLGSVVFTVTARLLLFIFLILYAIPFLIIVLVPMQYRLRSKVLAFLSFGFYWGILKCALVPIKYEGIENIPDEPCIIAANHQSSLDIPIIGKLAGFRPAAWLATDYLLNSALLRFWLPRIAVMVNSESPMQAMRSLLNIIHLVEDKPCHVMIFPEGQRYFDDHVHEFFGGFVILAKKLKRPVVPVCIVGANKVYPRGAFWANWHEIRVIVGAPLRYQDDDTDEIFKNRVHQWFIDLIGAA